MWECKKGKVFVDGEELASDKVYNFAMSREGKNPFEGNKGTDEQKRNSAYGWLCAHQSKQGKGAK